MSDIRQVLKQICKMDTLKDMAAEVKRRAIRGEAVCPVVALQCIREVILDIEGGVSEEPFIIKDTITEADIEAMGILYRIITIIDDSWERPAAECGDILLDIMKMVGHPKEEPMCVEGNHLH